MFSAIFHSIPHIEGGREGGKQIGENNTRHETAGRVSVTLHYEVTTTEMQTREGKGVSRVCGANIIRTGIVQHVAVAAHRQHTHTRGGVGDTRGG